MRFWLQAMYLLCSSKKGISSNQLHRMLGVTLKTAWFMSHRIREAMRVVGVEPMGGAGEIVEIDETFAGRIEGQSVPHGAGGVSAYRNTVLSLRYSRRRSPQLPCRRHHQRAIAADHPRQHLQGSFHHQR
jgi:hypothetical protein